MKLFNINIILIVTLFQLKAQTELMPQLICEMPLEIKETSGIYVQAIDSIWTHNDSNNEPKIYLMDTLSNIIKTITLSNATNVDWEDITYDNDGNVYLGDTGNNDNNRTDLKIYKIENPNNINAENTNAEVINYSYQDQTDFPPSANAFYFDCEAIMALGDSLYLFTKDYTFPYIGFSRVYWLPLEAGTYQAKPIGVFYTDNSGFTKGSITSAAHSPDGKKVAIMSYRKLWVFYDFPGNKFLAGSVKEFDFPNTIQREGIDFIDNCDVYISDEASDLEGSGNLYRLNLCDYIPSAVSDITHLDKLKISPQPAHDYVNVELPKGLSGLLEVKTIDGHLLYQKSIEIAPDILNIDISVFKNSGIYVCQFYTDRNIIFSNKILIVK